MTGSITTQPPSSESGASTGKRRRWGLAPDDFSTQNQCSEGGVNSDNKKTKIEHSSSGVTTQTAKEQETISKRMWISTSTNRPAAHYVNFMKDELEETPKHLSVNEGEGEKVLCTLEGRGSGSKPPTPGMPLEPLHVLLQASSQSLLTRAELLVDDLLQRAEEATVHPDLIAAAAANEVKMFGESDGEKKRISASSSLALATIQDPSMKSSSTSYKPASVAQLIGQVNHGGSVADSTEWLEETVQVPVGVVGFIIGKGGENIASMQARTGAKVQVQREAETPGNATHRKIHVSAPSDQALEECKQLIQGIVAEKSKMLGGAALNNANRKDAARLEEAKALGHIHLTVPVPDDDVGLVIGKGGATIRSLQDRTGASIQVPPAQESKDGKRLVHITHPTKEGADAAKELIEEHVRNHASNRGGTNVASTSSSNINTTSPSEPQISVTVMIPDPDVGLIIGKSGVIIRYLQESTRTQIQIPPSCLPGQDQRMATVTGTAAGCQQVQGLIAQIIADQSSAGIMAQALGSGVGGFGPGNTGNFYGMRGQDKQHPRYVQPREGQEGYSAEWAAYHAAQAVLAAKTTIQQPAYLGYHQSYHGVAAYPPQQNHSYLSASTPTGIYGLSGDQGSFSSTSQPHPTSASQASVGVGLTAGALTASSVPGTSSLVDNQVSDQTPKEIESHSSPVADHAPVSRDAYYEQFFRYAYYYGEESARRYYGAYWSPPEGTKNPYGENPNINAPTSGVAECSLPAASPATSHAAAEQLPSLAVAGPGAQGTTAGRETSVRKVSNLPAWMSKN